MTIAILIIAIILFVAMIIADIVKDDPACRPIDEAAKARLRDFMRKEARPKQPNL